MIKQRLRKCQEPVRRETTEGFSIDFIGYRMPQHEQNGCTVSFTSSVLGFFDILIGCLEIGI